VLGWSEVRQIRFVFDQKLVFATDMFHCFDRVVFPAEHSFASSIGRSTTCLRDRYQQKIEVCCAMSECTVVINQFIIVGVIVFVDVGLLKEQFGDNENTVASVGTHGLWY
jgi:hypothetical protein